MSDKNRITWTCRDLDVEVGSRTRVMGILNVTPDSFSDGGTAFQPDQAIEKGLRLMEEGADILDIGGESTRPGADPVDAAEEIRRVVPVIKAISEQSTALISVDTMKAAVAREALVAGAHIINDVSALTHDPGMVAVAREFRAGVVLMHMRGDPRTMQERPAYTDAVEEILDYLQVQVRSALDAGLAATSLALDPGIGFGKTLDHNLELIRGLMRFAEMGHPVLVGLSRKSFLGKLTGREVHDRLSASLAAMAVAITHGAHIIRVHDVKESCDVARVVDKLVKTKDAQREQHRPDILA